MMIFFPTVQKFTSPQDTHISVEHLKRGAIKETDGQASQLSGLADQFKLWIPNIS